MNVSAKERSQPNRSSLAKTLNLHVDTIKQKRNLLIGIWPEAVKLLQNHRASAGSIWQMRRVKLMHQIEMAEVMVASDNDITVYAKCFAMTSSPDQLLEPNQPTAPGGNGKSQRRLPVKGDQKYGK